MSYFKVSDLLENNNVPPFVLGTFFNRSIVDSNYVFTVVYFETNSFSNINLSDYKITYLEKLNKVSFPFTWELVNTSDKTFKAKLILENDLSLTKKRFFY